MTFTKKHTLIYVLFKYLDLFFSLELTTAQNDLFIEILCAKNPACIVSKGKTLDLEIE